MVTGSILVTWLCPSTLSDDLVQLVLTNAVIFTLEGVEGVTVAGAVVLQLETEKVRLLKLPCILYCMKLAIYSHSIKEFFVKPT